MNSAVLLCIFICISGIIPEIHAATGDVLWSQCGDIKTSYITLTNACAYLIEGSNCALNLSLTVGGSQVLMRTIDVGVVPQVCGKYRVNSFVECDVCAQIKDNPNNSSSQCLVINPVCAGIQIQQYTAGCFPKTLVGGILTCKQNLCPNDCSGNGACVNGECKCNANYYNSDCSSSVPMYEQCVQVNSLAGKICARLQFRECNATVGIYLDDFPLLVRSYAVSSLPSVFTQDLCVEAYDCNTCLKWNDLILNETMAYGCGAFQFSCFGLQYGPYNLQCFNDTGAVPKCFGKCPNKCSNHGTCENARCICFGDFSGDDCSTAKTPKTCNPDCVHGTCTNGVCVCDKHYDGDDCSSYVASTTTTGNGGSETGKLAAMVVVPIVVVAVGIAVVVAFYMIRKKRIQQEGGEFHRTDLLLEDSSINDDPAVEESETKPTSEDTSVVRLEDS